jgi:hypothetical protein
VLHGQVCFWLLQSAAAVLHGQVCFCLLQSVAAVRCEGICLWLFAGWLGSGVQAALSEVLRRRFRRWLLPGYFCRVVGRLYLWPCDGGCGTTDETIAGELQLGGRVDG